MRSKLKFELAGGPPVNRQTDRTENITFSHSVTGGKKKQFSTLPVCLDKKLFNLGTLFKVPLICKLLLNYCTFV